MTSQNLFTYFQQGQRNFPQADMIEVTLVTLVYIKNKINEIHSVTQGTRADRITDFCFANGDEGENCSSRIIVNILTDRALGSGYFCSSFSEVKMAEQSFF
jgi:hypothetical protein